MHRVLLVALLLPVAQMGCAVDATTPDEHPRSVDEDLRLTPIRGEEPVPFCLPGEKRVCTLGPPPLCHCELEPAQAPKQI